MTFSRRRLLRTSDVIVIDDDMHTSPIRLEKENDLSKESACEKTSDVIVIDDDMHTPPSQLQKVYDLSKESAQETYEWMRCVHCVHLHIINM